MIEIAIAVALLATAVAVLIVVSALTLDYFGLCRYTEEWLGVALTLCAISLTACLIAALIYETG